MKKEKYYPLIKNRKGGVNVYCLESIKTNEAFQSVGQGLYVWLFKEELDKIDLEKLDTIKQYLKFGQYGAYAANGMLPQETINSYVGTTIDPPVIVFSIRLTSEQIAKHGSAFEIEQKIKKNLGSIKKDGKSNECYLTTLEKIKSEVNKVLFGVSRPESYEMRPEQADAVRLAYHYFLNDGDEFLFNAKMRFGKTFAAYQLMKKLNAKKTLILTYKPAVVDGWKNDLESHKDFEGYYFFHALDFSKDNPINFDKKKHAVLFGSFQDILGKDLNGTIKKKWRQVLKEEYDLIIIDEVHFGYMTSNAQKMMSKLNFNKLLVMSGTPLKIIMSGVYTEEQTYTWSYIDEQKKRELEKKGGWQTEVYKYLPKMHLFTYSLSEDVLELVEYFEEEEGLTLSKFFASDDGTTLKNARAVDRWLDLLAAKSSRVFNSPFNNNRFAGKLNHMFWYLSGVNQVKALAKKLREHHYFSQYEVVIAAADNDGEGSDTLKIVRNKIDQFSKTITLSCGKLNTGVTVPEWDGVFMLNDGTAAETYLQTIFRVQSPNKDDEKMDCYVFDFNPNRALEIVYTYVEEITKNKDTKEGIREFLEVMEVLAYENNEFVAKSVEDIISVGIKPEKAIEKFESSRVANIANANDNIINILSLIEATKAKKEKIEVSESILEKGKTFKTQAREKTLDKKEKKNLIAKAITITKMVPTFMYLSNAQEQSLDDLLRTTEKDIFKETTGVSLEEFKYMVQEKFLNRRLLDRAIQSFSLLEI